MNLSLETVLSGVKVAPAVPYAPMLAVEFLGNFLFLLFIPYMYMYMHPKKGREKETSAQKRDT